VGEEGTEMIVDCGRDISTAADLRLLVQKPDGTVVEWVAGQYLSNKNAIRYVTEAGDFDQSGEYEMQSKITMGGFIGLGKTVKFIVYDRFA
jgi:hypothetical protein